MVVSHTSMGVGTTKTMGKLPSWKFGDLSKGWQPTDLVGHVGTGSWGCGRYDGNLQVLWGRL